MVLRATIAEYAGAQSASRKAAAAEIQTATWGERKVGETRATAFENGRPPSRANAKSMRELEGTLERPQNHIATIAPSTRAPPSRCPSAPRSTWMKGFSVATVEGRSPIASVTARSSAQPKTPLTETERKIHHGALRVVSCVSSHACALAS